MLTTNIQQPVSCAICGNYLTTSDHFAGRRCLDPSHWQATGLLHPTDFYEMAQVAARAGMEQKRRFIMQQQK